MGSRRFDNQVGPDVEGKGQITIYSEGRTVVLYYSPQVPSMSRVRYKTDSETPYTPMPVRQEIEIAGEDKITVEYQVRTEGDIKIAWSILP